MKQFFFSYHVYKNESICGYGHGDVSVDEESPDAYEEAILKAEKAFPNSNIHLIAFNKIN